MNINNDNYEEYFLLYADNELTAAQRTIVEMFVKANPHLQKEWNELMATIQRPENILFPNKSRLLKRPADGFIDLYNYEKRFVEFHDGELNEEEKIFVQHFLQENPLLEKEFNFIGQAYVSPDNSIVFQEKGSLYRESAMVRYGLFIRIAAAAIFIGLIFWLGVQLSGNQNPQKTIVKNVPAAKIPENISPEPKPVIKESMLAGNKHEEPVPEKILAESAKAKVPASVVSIEPSKQVNIQKKENIIPPQHTEIAVMIPVVSDETTLDGSKTVITSDITNTVEPTHTIAINDNDVPAEKELPTFRQEPQENNYVFTDIPAENLQRSKLGILIKKVKRTIDRNNPINRMFNGEED